MNSEVMLVLCFKVIDPIVQHLSNFLVLLGVFLVYDGIGQICIDDVLEGLEHIVSLFILLLYSIYQLLLNEQALIYVSWTDTNEVNSRAGVHSPADLLFYVNVEF